MAITTVSTAAHVQVPSAPPSAGRGIDVGAVAKGAAIGGALGAVAGFGLSFIGPLPIIGGMFAPLAAAIGGAAGIVVGGVVGLLRSRSASPDAQMGASGVQTPPPPGTGRGGALPPAPPLPAR